MLPLQYEHLVRGYRRHDLLAKAAQERLAHQVSPSREAQPVRRAALDVVCRLPLPVLEPACAAQPA
jgi:hypothetical protein